MANLNIDYLVVGAGGGGGSANGASGSGGGAGEYLYQTGQTILTGIAYTVDVGINGVGGATAGNGQNGTSGVDSSFNNYIARGGGFGVVPNLPGNGGDGGSGGGANYPTNSPGSSTAVSPGLGNSGGAGSTVGGGAGAYGSGGGGGAAQAGFPGTTSVAGNGGDGIYNSITGTSTAYAAGGGGGIFAPSGQYTFGIGGSGGTGGSSSITNNASDGAPSTGSGGGGGSYSTSTVPYNGGNGAQGIVILRWLTTDAGYTVSGANPTETIDGAYTVLSFTAVVTSTITFNSTPKTKISSALVDFNSGTEDGLKLPSGDDANQPTGVQGMIRNNTNSGMSSYNGSDWTSLDATESPDPPPVPPTPPVLATSTLYLDASNTTSYPGTGSTWFDLTANGNNGTIVGPQWNSSGWFDFDGTSDMVSIPSTTDFNATSSNPVSMGGWFYMTASQLNSFWSKGFSTYEYFCFARTDQGSGNYINFNTYLNGGGQVGLSWTNSAVTNNTWYHVIVTLDTLNQSAKLYVNGGAPKDTDTSFSASSVGTQPLLIGMRGDLSWDLQGRNSKFNFWSNKILTQAEVQSLYDYGF